MIDMRLSDLQVISLFPDFAADLGFFTMQSIFLIAENFGIKQKRT